jgi:hypothetical protein
VHEQQQMTGIVASVFFANMYLTNHKLKFSHTRIQETTGVQQQDRKFQLIIDRANKQINRINSKQHRSIINEEQK